MTRAFIAIRPPERVLDAIEARVEGIAIGDGRPTSRDQWHLTVQFLGDDADVEEVLRSFAADPLDLGPGELQLGGATVFGSPRRARVLSLRLHEGAGWSQALAVQVERRVEPLGHEPDRPGDAFVPHLTLARYARPSDLRRVCASIGAEPVGSPWRVDEVVLYESELGPQGARHVVHARFPTGARSSGRHDGLGPVVP